ncbi:MAG: hypothetical protein ACO1QR_06425 [Chthoniobacteraceae bacterium]
MISRVAMVARVTAAFVVGLLVCGGALRLADRELDRGTVRNKLTHFAEHASEYDTLFFGSSRMYRQIVPAVFDEVTAGHGIKTNAFNFGVDGMFAPEDGYVAEKIFALKPKLRWVFIEVSLFQAAHAEQNVRSARAVYWHDFRRTWLVCRELWADLKPFRWKNRQKRIPEYLEWVDRCLIHLEACGRRTFQIGRGAEMWEGVALDKQAPVVTGVSLGERADGFVPVERPNGMTPFDLAEWERQFARMMKKGVRREPLSEPAQENLEGILELVRATGATPALVIAPTTAPITFVPRRDVNVPLLDFSRMEDWPVFFEKKYRVDVAHLNAAGGEIYTRFIAQRWLSYLQDGREIGTAAELEARFGADASSLDERISTP